MGGRGSRGRCPSLRRASVDFVPMFAAVVVGAAYGVSRGEGERGGGEGFQTGLFFSLLNDPFLWFLVLFLSFLLCFWSPSVPVCLAFVFLVYFVVLF